MEPLRFQSVMNSGIAHRENYIVTFGDKKLSTFRFQSVITLGIALKKKIFGCDCFWATILLHQNNIVTSPENLTIKITHLLVEIGAPFYLDICFWHRGGAFEFRNWHMGPSDIFLGWVYATPIGKIALFPFVSAGLLGWGVTETEPNPTE